MKKTPDAWEAVGRSETHLRRSSLKINSLIKILHTCVQNWTKITSKVTTNSSPMWFQIPIYTSVTGIIYTGVPDTWHTCLTHSHKTAKDESQIFVKPKLCSKKEFLTLIIESLPETLEEWCGYSRDKRFSSSCDAQNWRTAWYRQKQLGSKSNHLILHCPAVWSGAHHCLSIEASVQKHMQCYSIW